MPRASSPCQGRLRALGMPIPVAFCFIKIAFRLKRYPGLSQGDGVQAVTANFEFAKCVTASLTRREPFALAPHRGATLYMRA